MGALFSVLAVFAGGDSHEKASQSIFTLANTFFTRNKINDAENKKTISHETASFLAEVPTLCQTLVPEGDQSFTSTPGYLALKQKIQRHMEQLATALGYAGIIHQPTPHISAAEHTALHRDLETILTSIDTIKTNPKITAKRILEISRETLAEINKLSPKSPETKKIRGGLVQLKQEFYRKLRWLDQQFPEEVKQFERPDCNLTLATAYKNCLKTYTDFLHRTPKRLSTQHEENIKNTQTDYALAYTCLEELDKDAALSFATPKTTHKPLNIEQSRSLAINVRGDLYELEEALNSTRLGKKILALGATVTLAFSPTDHAPIIKEIESKSFLNKMFGDKTKTTVEQEFDLVTDQELIECKCIESSQLNYLENLQRQQWFANNIQSTPLTHVRCEDSCEELDPSVIANKKILFCVKYAKENMRNTEGVAQIEAMGFPVQISTPNTSITAKTSDATALTPLFKATRISSSPLSGSATKKRSPLTIAGSPIKTPAVQASDDKPFSPKPFSALQRKSHSDEEAI